MHPLDQLRYACCQLANMIEDVDKAAVCCAGCYYEPSDVAFLLLGLLFSGVKWSFTVTVTSKTHVYHLPQFDWICNSPGGEL